MLKLPKIPYSLAGKYLIVSAGVSQNCLINIHNIYKFNIFVKGLSASGIQQKFCKILSSRINMETRAITIKCVHLGYDALVDMFQYENSSFALCDLCRGLILSDIKVSEVV